MPEAQHKPDLGFGYHFRLQPMQIRPELNSPTRGLCMLPPVIQPKHMPPATQEIQVSTCPVCTKAIIICHLAEGLPCS